MVGRDVDLPLRPPACTLINLSPPIQTGALADHCCGLWLGEVIRGRRTEAMDARRASDTAMATGERVGCWRLPKRELGKKKMRRAKYQRTICIKLMGRGEVIQPTILHQKNKDFMLVFQLNMLQKLFILYSRTKLLQPHTFSVCCNVKKHELCIVLVCFLAKIINK